MRWHVREAVAQAGESERSDEPARRTNTHETCLREIREQLGHKALFAQVFVTAARAFFSQVLASLFTQLRDGGTLDPFVVEFGAFLEQTRSTLLQKGLYEDENTELSSRSTFRKAGIQRLQQTFAKVLRGKLVKTPVGEAILTDDQRTIPISLAASGQQEALPLLLMLSRCFLLSRGHGRSIYIEEPEAHLFPAAQKDVVEPPPPPPPPPPLPPSWLRPSTFGIWRWNWS